MAQETLSLSPLATISTKLTVVYTIIVGSWGCVIRWFMYAPCFERMHLIALNLWLTHIESLALTGLTPESSKQMQPFKSEITSSNSLSFFGDFSCKKYGLRSMSSIRSKDLPFKVSFTANANTSLAVLQQAL